MWTWHYDPEHMLEDIKTNGLYSDARLRDFAVFAGELVQGIAASVECNKAIDMGRRYSDHDSEEILEQYNKTLAERQQSMKEFLEGTGSASKVLECCARQSIASSLIEDPFKAASEAATWAKRAAPSSLQAGKDLGKKLKELFPELVTAQQG